MIKIFFLALLMTFLSSAMATEAQTGKVIYKYKKYEKFDLDDLAIEGDSSNPGDLSIDPRFRTKFKNKLPGRENFNKEMVDAIEAIR